MVGRLLAYLVPGWNASSEGILGGSPLAVCLFVTSVDPGFRFRNLLFPEEREPGPEPEMFVLLGVILLLVFLVSKNAGKGTVGTRDTSFAAL